jgi:putative nucleotidyltransferase with HDIG domain
MKFMTNSELFNEISNHLLSDEKPSIYLNKLKTEGLLNKEPFSWLLNLEKIEQSKKYHPEGSVWNHVMLVVDNASKLKNKSENKQVFMWGALLHDIGKLTTTKLRKGRITSYNHDVEGEKLVTRFLKMLTDDEDFIVKVSKITRWHMQPLFVSKNLPFSELTEMISEINIEEIGLISLADRLGRGNMTEEIESKERESINKFLKVCNDIDNN